MKGRENLMETHMPQHCVMRNEKNVVLASLSTNGGMKQKNNPPTQQQPQVKREREREREGRHVQLRQHITILFFPFKPNPKGQSTWNMTCDMNCCVCIWFYIRKLDCWFLKLHVDLVFVLPFAWWVA